MRGLFPNFQPAGTFPNRLFQWNEFFVLFRRLCCFIKTIRIKIILLFLPKREYFHGYLPLFNVFFAAMSARMASNSVLVQREHAVWQWRNTRNRSTTQTLQNSDEAVWKMHFLAIGLSTIWNSKVHLPFLSLSLFFSTTRLIVGIVTQLTFILLLCEMCCLIVVFVYDFVRRCSFESILAHLSVWSAEWILKRDTKKTNATESWAHL